MEMNTRERFLAITSGEKVDRTLKWEMGYWGGAVRRWYKEGLPCKKGMKDSIPEGGTVFGEDLTIDPETMNPIDAADRDTDIREYFGFDEPIWRVPLNNYLCPYFKEEILEDDGDLVLIRDKYGVQVRNRKDKNGFPHWVETPVKNRDDWEKLKAERLQPTLKGRLPGNWSRWKKIFNSRTFPLIFGGYPTGFYGTARFLLGEEKVMLAFYDMPDVMKDIMDYMTDFWIRLYEQILDQISVDGILIWEDMSFKGGPLISPEMFKQFILPNYKKLSNCLKRRGVNVIMVDTDGYCRELIPLFVEGGVNLLGPFEQAANMDITEVRRAFPELVIVGGIDKTKIKNGRRDIDKELEKAPWMLSQGGYIPHIDHQVPPDVSWEDFRYYRNKLNALIDEA